MEGNVAATYTLIYRFLKQQSQNKAAEAVKKAAKQFVVLRDDIEHQGSPLEDIIKAWRASKNIKSENADSSSEESESSDDSSSDSEDSSGAGSSSGNSDSSSDGSDESPQVRKIPPKGAAERDTSATLSSAKENVREASKQVVQIPKEKSTEDDSESSESDNSDSDSSSSGSSSKSSASDSSDAETSSNNSESSSGLGSSDEDEAGTDDKAPRMTTKSSSGSSGSESSSDCEDGSESEKEDEHVAKKRKTFESGVAAVEQVARLPREKGMPPLKVREHFQRVKLDNFASKTFLDNGYEARGGASNDYGRRAHLDLVVTRGAGFRKEKNKKKRGSYRGGEITMENHSIRFDF